MGESAKGDEPSPGQEEDRHAARKFREDYGIDSILFCV